MDQLKADYLSQHHLNRLLIESDEEMNEDDEYQIDVVGDTESNADSEYNNSTTSETFHQDGNTGSNLLHTVTNYNSSKSTPLENDKSLVGDDFKSVSIKVKNEFRIFRCDNDDKTDHKTNYSDLKANESNCCKTANSFSIESLLNKKS